jgi:YVTN family beta-propeller protein
MRRYGAFLPLFALLPLAVPAPAPKSPVYIGAKACGACHAAAHLTWVKSKHATAFDSLYKPESWTIARLSGISAKPWESPICLGCHSTAFDSEKWERDGTFRPVDGLQCEGCHGPGSDYADAEIMRDARRAMAAGLRKPATEYCAGCHIEKNSHTKVLRPAAPFDRAAWWKRIAHSRQALPQPSSSAADRPVPVYRASAPPSTEPVYKNPLFLAFRPKSRELWIANEAAGTVTIVESATRAILAEMKSGGAPTAIAFSPNGGHAYVSNRLDDTVTVFDTATRRAIRKLPAGDEPHGILTDAAGQHLYVLNTASDDIAVYDTRSLERVKKLQAGRAPWALALSPDGTRLLASNLYSHMTGFLQPMRSEVTVIGTARSVVDDRIMVPDTNLMAGIAWHPSGEYAMATLNRTKNLVPMTRLMQGWTITNGLAMIGADGSVNQVLLDLPGLGFADATGIAFTPDGRYALVTSSGTDRLAVVDAARLRTLIDSATEEDRLRRLPNQLGLATEFVAKFLPTGRSPRGVVASPDGRFAYTANSLDDSVSVFDLKTLAPAGVIPLGGPAQISLTRRGERLFHSADITFRKQFSCHSCHPDGHVDQVAYDIEADGIGVSPVDNRTLRGISDTAPFKWEGTNPSLQRQCGARLSVFFTRVHPFDKEQLAAVDHYITTIARPPNRYRPQGADLTPAQRRGKVIFYRGMTNDGRVIPNEGRCGFCHMPPYYTNRLTFDVGTKSDNDRTGLFDVPHLNNIYDSAPYLHNGSARTLEEIWTVYNPYDKHGYTNDMTKDQLNDLIEYLKTL